MIALSAIDADGQAALTAQQISAAGKFDGQLYTNRQAGFSILMPGGWARTSESDDRATAEQGRNATRALAARDSTQTRAAIETSISRTAILFQASSKPTRPGAGRALMSSGIEVFSRQMTIDRYIRDNKSLVLRNPAYKLTNDVHTRRFGQADFVVFEIESESDGKPFRQIYAATVRGEFAIFFVFTLLDRSYDGLINNSLASFKLLK